MDFPIVPEDFQYPSTAHCAVCGRRVGETLGYITMNFGTDSGVPGMLWHLFVHGPHPLTGRIFDGEPEIAMNNEEASIEIVKVDRYSQADLLFCASDCVERFFSEIVARIRSEKIKMQDGMI